MKIKISLVVQIALVVALLLLVAAIPSMAQPAPSARDQVLQYLQSLDGRGDNRILIGQFGFYGDGETPALANQVLTNIATAGGREVALTGADYGSVEPSVTRAATNQWLIAQWRKGRLVTLSWHAPNPFGKPANTDDPPAACLSGDGQCNKQNVADLLTPGKPAYDVWQAALKQTADDLTPLRDAGVVVIWRPFHENNGAWFWWNQQKQADFVALWKQMHTYFTSRGLNNLLWAFSPNVQWDQYAQCADFYYPGAAFVDIVGLDYYAERNRAEIDINQQKCNGAGSYDQLARLGKPFLLLEFGPTPASGAGWQDTPYDFSTLIRDIKTKYPKIVGFQAWEWIFAIDKGRGIRAMMDDAWAVTLDDLPRFDGSLPPTPIPITATPTRAAPTGTVTRTPIPITATPTPSAERWRVTGKIGDLTVDLTIERVR